MKARSVPELSQDGLNAPAADGISIAAMVDPLEKLQNCMLSGLPG
jgi:hypothetical protein